MEGDSHEILELNHEVVEASSVHIVSRFISGFISVRSVLCSFVFTPSILVSDDAVKCTEGSFYVCLL